MSLPHGLLGLLTYADNTGYDLSKLFSESLNFFWSAQSSQIYRELDRMEQTGWVTSQSIVQEGRPNKRLYSITAEGRQEFQRWLVDFDCQPQSNHNALIMRIFFGAEIDPEKTVELLRGFRRQCIEDLEALQVQAQLSIDSYGQVFAGGELKKTYWRLTVEGGIAELRALIAWAAQSIEALGGEVEVLGGEVQ